MVEPCFVFASARHSQAENFYLHELYRVIKEIDSTINAAACNGKYQITVRLEEIQQHYSISLESLTYVFNKLKNAGFEIDDQCTYWIVKW